MQCSPFVSWWTVFSSYTEVAKQECKVMDNIQIIVEYNTEVAKQECKVMDVRQIKVEYNTQKTTRQHQKKHNDRSTTIERTKK